MTKRRTTEDILLSFKNIFEGIYDYPNFEHSSNKQKIEVYCKKHTLTFFPTVNNHLRGSRCPKCGAESAASKKTERTIIGRIDRLSKKFPDIDFSNTPHVNGRTIIQPKCKKHGEFETTFAKLECSKHGCQQCGAEAKSKSARVSHEEFTRVCEELNGNLVDYSESKYTGCRDSITLRCKSCDKYFCTTPYIHKNQGTSCPHCFESDGEKRITTYLETNNILFEKQKSFKDCSYKKTLKFDFFLPNHNLLLEYDGRQHYQSVDYFGGEKAFKETQKRDKIKNDWVEKSEYKLIRIPHFRKNRIQEILDFETSLPKLYKVNFINLENPSNLIKDKINIFSDYWSDKREIVYSRINNLKGKSHRIFARKTEVREVPTKEAMIFLDKNHLQGRVGGSVKLGLYFEGELISLMTFGGFRKNLGREARENCYEMLRFCNKLNTQVIGGASKILKNFENKYSPKELISYSDNCWGEGNLYFKLGFQYLRDSKPNYYYVKNGKRYNRFKFRKSELVKQGFDKDKTEKQIMAEEGYLRVHDLGSKVFSKRNN